MKIRIFVVLGLGLVVVGCGRGGVPAAGTGSRVERVEGHVAEAGKDLRQAGHELKEAAREMVGGARPALVRAKEKTREVLHDWAQRVADWTVP